MTPTLHLSAALRARITAEACAAFPNECCGLIEAERAGETIRATALHPTANVADDPAAGFEIDPAAHIRLRCELRGTGRSIVGCYHSHPTGRPTPSERDRASGCEADFVWIIAAVAGDEVTLAAFEGPEFSVVDLL
jgi:proteasome lid subunit RPN8/RPN11